jgi:hypothetical protein
VFEVHEREGRYDERVRRQVRQRTREVQI